MQVLHVGGHNTHTHSSQVIAAGLPREHFLLHDRVQQHDLIRIDTGSMGDDPQKLLSLQSWHAPIHLKHEVQQGNDQRVAWLHLVGEQRLPGGRGFVEVFRLVVVISSSVISSGVHNRFADVDISTNVALVGGCVAVRLLTGRGGVFYVVALAAATHDEHLQLRLASGEYVVAFLTGWLVERPLALAVQVLVAADIAVAVRVVVVAVVAAVHGGAEPLAARLPLAATPGVPGLVPAGSKAEVVLIDVHIVVLARLGEVNPVPVLVVVDPVLGHLLVAVLPAALTCANVGALLGQGCLP
mmetsp:Transcript_16185/g.45108  ORF Transcript_16185/g.45108 Transcript_16185/m.45108 type:complete len:298 (+) Transcript_16185:861-1754(+)